MATYKEENKTKIIDIICKHITDNKASLRDALLLPKMPSSQTFYKWIENDKFKAKQYVHACEARADSIFDEMLDIADDGTNDYMMKILNNGDVIEVLNSEHVQRSRLRIDARKWMLSKMNPKKYGDKLDVTTGNKSLNERPQFVFMNKSSENG